MQPLSLKPSRHTPSAALGLAAQRKPRLQWLRLRCQSLGMALLVLAGMSHGLVVAQTNFPPVTQSEIFHVLTTRNELSLTERFSRVIELDSRITRVDGFDPAILTVSALSPHRIRVQAVSAGVTTLILVDEFDKTYSVEIFVEGDVRHLQSYISRFFPDSSVTAVKVKDSVVLRGVVADPTHISQITEVAEQFFPKVINQMQFGAASQVRLQVRIMEAQRSRIRELGFDWSLQTSGGNISSTPGKLVNPTIQFGIVSGTTAFAGFLEALKTERLLKILVETSVVADSGRPASLLSGGEFPFLVPQSLGTNTVEWKEYGVKLEAVPIVVGRGQVILEIAPEFSERDYSNAIVLSGETLPGLVTRRANTQVRVKFGQTLMIGGLINTRYTAETDKVPLLGELPGIGMAFRKVRYEENETELIILVTPEYVAPLDPHQVPDGGPGQFTTYPTDRELYWQGLIEVPNYGGPMPPNAGGYHEEVMIPTEKMMLPPPGSPPIPVPGLSKPDDFLMEEGPLPLPLETTPPPQQKTKTDLVPVPMIPLPDNANPPKPPTPVELPPMSPAPEKNEASTIPLLPVMPAPASREKPRTSGEISEIGHWQRRTQPAVEQAGGQGVSRTQSLPLLTNNSQIEETRDYDLTPPSLIQPTRKRTEATTVLTAPDP